MRVPLFVAIAVLSLLPCSAFGQQPAPSPPPAVKVGQPAPDFTLRYLAKTADGKYQPKTVSLGQFKGEKTVILAFFPAAFSPG